MNIELKEITVRELTNGYEDNQEDGVIGFGGKLDIRPPFQREFVYNEKQRNAVVDTINKGFPLNVMYWAVKGNDEYEIIDGQQRTISICQYVNGDFSVNGMGYHNLQNDQKESFLNYTLMVYMCEGRDSEKLEWFKTINIAGATLTTQELRNAVYSGTWVTDAKRYFSKTGCVASNIASDYMSGSPIRQEYLETAIKWINNGNIESYMSKHQHHQNASQLWQYFQSVITWVDTTFKVKRNKFMKGIDWGGLYNEFRDKTFDTDEIEQQTEKLIADDDVTSKKGIYPYILTGKQKHLSIRAFTDSQKQTAYESQGKKCANARCESEKDTFDISEMEGDHIIPWHEGGKTENDNLQMLCKDCNRRKGGR